MDDEWFAEAAVDRWKQGVEKWLAENPETVLSSESQERLRTAALKGAELLAIAFCEGPEVRRQLDLTRRFPSKFVTTDRTSL